MDSKIHLTYWVIIVLVLMAALYFWNRNGRGEEIRLAENQKFQAKIQERDSHIAKATQAIADERSKRSADSAKTANRLKSLSVVNISLTKKLQASRPDIQPYLDSIKAVGEFVAMQDSSLEVKDLTIAVLEMSLDTTRQSYDREIKQWQQKNAEQQAKTALWQEESAKNAALYFKADKKARRHFSVGPYIGYGMSNNGLSPSVGISLQYRLIRW